MGLMQLVQTVYNQVVGGVGPVVTKYPANAAGTALTASGMTTGAYKFAAAGANVKAIVAKATITSQYRIVALGLDTPSANSLFVIRVGRGAAAGAAVTQVLMEIHANLAVANGPFTPIVFPFIATVAADGATDAVLADAASSNAGADDTIQASVSVMTGMGS